MTGLYVLLAALASTGVLAGWHRSRDGRLRQTRAVRRATAGGGKSAATTAGAQDSAPDGREDLRPLIPTGPLIPTAGDRATLLQFSSAFCAPCRATRRTLAQVADLVEGVAHVEIDAESHLELVRRLNIVRTPTTLVLDQHGREVVRASGQPNKTEVLKALGQAVPS